MKDNTQYVVVGRDTQDYHIDDVRTKKPLAFKNNDGSMILQEVDEIKFRNKYEGEKNILSYYSPNNVGILLSIAYKSKEEAKKIFNEYFNPEKFDHRLRKKEGQPDKIIKEDSRLVYDYIELIQISLVFGYTAIETFVNLSIPDDYVYIKKVKNRGTEEHFDKKAIERWISLRDKLSLILPDIYETPPFKRGKLWNDFIRFENFRDDIIHQKAISETEFYKTYFKSNFFNNFNVPEDIMKFFFEKRKDKNSTNPLWPWVINSRNDFPISYDFKPNQFEVTGNLFEGKYKE